MNKMLISIGIMAGITYLIRVLPIAIFQKEIKSIFIRSFLYYIPYAVLAALTFPSIFSATGNELISLAGTAVALVLAYFDLGLVIVALGSVVAAVITGIATPPGWI
jgi:branched-subunit amino acid transport protein